MTVSSLPDPTVAGGAEPRHDANRGQAKSAPSPAIRRATDSDRAGWDRFVDSNPAGTFFHRYAWADVLRASFGYEPHYLVAEEADAIVGLLSLVHKKSALFGDAVVSLPFCSYGGPLGVSSTITQMLAEYAVQLTHDLGADYVELRGGVPSDGVWIRRDDMYATFEQPIEQSPDAIMASIPRKGRKHALRQSLEAGLSFEIHEDLTDFYRVISESYRNLGTPIFPRHYFEALRNAFPENFAVYVVRQGTEPLAASLAFAYRDHLHPLYAGGTAAARNEYSRQHGNQSEMLEQIDRGRFANQPHTS